MVDEKGAGGTFRRQGSGDQQALKNIFGPGELVEASVISILETTAADGKNHQTRYYNIDAIIAVGHGPHMTWLTLCVFLRHIKKSAIFFTCFWGVSK